MSLHEMNVFVEIISPDFIRDDHCRFGECATNIGFGVMSSVKCDRSELDTQN